MNDITVLFHKGLTGLYEVVVRNADNEIMYIESNLSTFHLAIKHVDEFIWRMK